MLCLAPQISDIKTIPVLIKYYIMDCCMHTFIITWYCIVSLLIKGNIAQMKDPSNNLHHTALVFIRYSYYIHCFLKTTEEEIFLTGL